MLIRPPIFMSLSVCLLCVVAGLALAARSQADEVYKTIDASGHVVYSDHPTSAASEKLSVPVKQADPAEAVRLAKERAIEDAEYAQRSRQEADEQSKEAARSKQQAARCTSARNHYFSMKDSRRLFKLDADGNRVFYSDEEADGMKAAAKQAMDQACGG
jgi:Domain of unknown function (DUF4124)